MQNTYKQKEQRDLGWSDASRYRGRSQVGTVLKQARETYQLTIEEVSETIRVRRIYLQAIEDGRYDLLPGIAYAVGFVRIYSDYLGLDTARLVDQFKAESGGQQYEDDFDFPEMVEKSNLPKGIVIALGVFMAILAIGLYWFFNRDQTIRPQEETPPSANISINQRPEVVEVPQTNPNDNVSNTVPSAQPQPAETNPPQALTISDILGKAISTTPISPSGNIYIAPLPLNYTLPGWNNMANIKIIHRPDPNTNIPMENINLNNQDPMINVLNPNIEIAQVPDTSVYPKVVIKALEPSYIYIIDTQTDQFLKDGALERNEEYVLLNDQNAQIMGATGKLIAILNGEYEVPIDTMTNSAQKIDYESLKQKGIALGIVPVDTQ